MWLKDLFRSDMETMQRMADKSNNETIGLVPPQAGTAFMKEYRNVDRLTLISGGSQSERLWAEYNRMMNGLRKGYSVVAIICPERSDHILDSSARYPGENPQAAWTGTVCLEDGSQWGFDPLLSGDPQMLSTILAKVSASISDGGGARSDYWRFVLDLLMACHGKLGLKEFLELDCQKILDQMKAWYTERRLKAATYQEFFERYDKNLSTQAAAASDLCSMLRPMKKCLREKNVGMDELCRRRGVMVLDSIPRAAINLMLQLLAHSKEDGKLMLVTDGIGFDEKDSVRMEFFHTPELAIPMVIGGDLPSLLGSVFDDMVKNNSLRFTFRHDSGTSAEKCSSAFGVYPKKVVEYSVGDDKRNTAIVEKSKGKSIVVRTDENAHKIQVNQIQNLKEGCAYVQVPGFAGIYQLSCPSISLEQMREKLVCSKKK